MINKLSLAVIILLFSFGFVSAQNVGIGTSEPAHLLDVNGKIRVQDDPSVPAIGAIRFINDKNDFEGYDGQEWKSFTQPNQQSFNTNNDGFGFIHNMGQGSCDDGQSLDYFGTTVDVVGDFIAVGVPKAHYNGLASAGVVYIFKRNGYHFYQYAKITSPEPSAGELFGKALTIELKDVIISNIQVAVGAPGDDNGKGTVYLFTFDSDGTYDILTIKNSNGMPNDSFGYSVSKPFKILDDTTRVAIGSPYSESGAFTNKGSAFIAKIITTSTFSLTQINADDGKSGDLFGYSIAADSNYAIVGAPFHDIINNGTSVPDAGAAYLWTKEGVTAEDDWEAQYKLAWDEPGVIDNFFGHSVDLNVQSNVITAIVGAPNYDLIPGDDNGRAFIYSSIIGSDTWTTSELAVGEEGVCEDKPNKPKPKKLGFSVSLDDNLAILGAPETKFFNECTNSNIQNVGRCYVFEKICNIWTLLSPVTDVINNGPLKDSRGGHCVSISGDRFVIGVPGANVNGKVNQGKFITGRISSH
jgi:hypothetical protein